MKTQLCTTFVVALVFATGCASTTIETPIGRYTSTRDSQLDELTIVIDKQPDGGEHTEVRVGGAAGDASTVIDAQTEMLRAFFEAAYMTGLRAATSAGIPGGSR